jgi:hypothetical protein
VNHLNLKRQNGSALSRKKVATFSLGICIIFAIISVACVVCGHRVMDLDTWTPGEHVRQMANTTKFMFWAASESWPLGPRDFILAFIQIVIQFYLQFVSFFTNLCLLMYVLTFAAVAERLTNICLDSRASLDEVLREYRHAKRIVDLVNQTIGPMPLGCLAEEVVYYMTFAAELLTQFVVDWLTLRIFGW